MRVLFLSYLFPPYNTIGAVRSGKTAAYLTRFGHEVRVVSAADQPLQPTLPLEIPQQNVVYTKWLNLNRPVEWALGGRKRVAAEGFVARGRSRRLLNRLGSLYKSAIHVPDGQIGWYPYAVQAASRMVEEHRPDLIFATAMPFTSLLVAHRLWRKYAIPWVAELRDLWTDNPYDEWPRWRGWLERRLERRVLSSACGMVTVSDPLAEVLRKKYGTETEVVLNGFDPEDYPKAQERPADDDCLRIVYTGMIYEGRRDPAPLFEALRRLGPSAARVRVDFYGRYLDVARRQAAQHGVTDQVEIHSSVAYSESLGIQRSSDVLLLLLWDDPRERGVYTGKLFEYFGARRPILALGPKDNVAAALIKRRGAGFVSNDPSAIANQLRQWIREKDDRGSIPATSEEALFGLSRGEQASRLERFLLNTLARHGRQRQAGSAEPRRPHIPTVPTPPLKRSA